MNWLLIAQSQRFYNALRGIFLIRTISVKDVKLRAAANVLLLKQKIRKQFNAKNALLMDSICLIIFALNALITA